jgi:hypothetical protein
VLAVLLSGLGGCSSPRYAVTDPATGVLYLTREIESGSGAVRFRDAVRREEVTVEGGEAVRIGEHEYRELLRAERAAAEGAE